MGAEDTFKESIKQAFSKVKEDILHLEAELRQNKALLEEVRKELSNLRLEPPTEKKEADLALNTPLFPMESNKQTNKQTQNQTLEQEDYQQNIKIKQKNAFEELKNMNLTVSKIFENLTKKEFKTFLLIYQLVEEQGSLTYKEIEQKLNISAGAARSYISTSIQKGAPIIKKRLKDNSVILALDPSFLGLNLKEKLISYYYYKRDPHQTTLF